MNKEPRPVMIVEDNEAARLSLEQLLSQLPDINVTALVENCREAKAAFLQQKPEVVFPMWNFRMELGLSFLNKFINPLPAFICC